MSKNDRFIRESEFKLMLSFMMKELKDEYRTLREGLKDEYRTLREDVNSLQENMKDIKTDIQYISNHIREDMKDKKTELQYIRNHVLPHTQLVTNTENKECRFTVTDTKDTTVHIDEVINNTFELLQTPKLIVGL
jgi:archaellum component FlaC